MDFETWYEKVAKPRGISRPVAQMAWEATAHLKIRNALADLLQRIQEERGAGFWGRKPRTDFEVAAQRAYRVLECEGLG